MAAGRKREGVWETTSLPELGARADGVCRAEGEVRGVVSSTRNIDTIK